MMEYSQPASQDTPSNGKDTELSAIPVWDLVAETIKASSRVRCANRPDTRLLLTSAKLLSKNVLLCGSYLHMPFPASAKSKAA